MKKKLYFLIFVAVLGIITIFYLQNFKNQYNSPPHKKVFNKIGLSLKINNYFCNLLAPFTSLCGGLYSTDTKGFKSSENYENKAENLFSRKIKINETEIKAREAVSTEDKVKGLGVFEKIEENEGMIFIYENPGVYGFWMKNMKFPIDIIWIDKNKKIIDITKNIGPETFPEVFKPKSPAKYVLEVKSGFADKNQIKEGDYAEF